jgi:hypothetical protein
MKIRNGFVSNSSSSSFIISSPLPPDKIKITIERSIDYLFDYCISTEDELVMYFKKNFGDDFLEDVEELFERCLKLLNDGQNIYVGSASNDSSSGLENYIYEEGLYDVNAEIIMCE